MSFPSALSNVFASASAPISFAVSTNLANCFGSSCFNVFLRRIVATIAWFGDRVATERNRESKGGGSGNAPTTPETVSQTVRTRSSSKPITSFGIFELCIQRARNLVKLHEAAHGKAGKPERFTSDAHRAAIVLAISALDAFVRDFVITRVSVLLATKSLSLPSSLSAQILKFVDQAALLDAARKDDLLDRVEKAFRSDFEKKSFQGTKIIDEHMRWVGYEDIFRDLASKAGTNESNLKAELNKFTQRRHAIAHRGDYDLNENPPKENVITKKDAEDCIRLVCLVATHMHGLSAAS
jgi:hypothetical protein